MKPLLASELFRLRRRLLPKAMLLIIVGLLIGVYLVQSAPDPSTEAGANVGDLRFAEVPGNGLPMVFQLVMVMSVVLAASSIATEYGWGTIRTLLSRTGSRPAFLTAKLIGVAAFTLLALILAVTTVYAASYAVSLWRDLGTSAGEDAASRFLLGPVRVLVATLPYISLSFLAGLWTRTTAAGFGAVVIVFYLDVLLGPLFEAGEVLSWVPEDLLIWQNVSGLLDASELQNTASTPDAWPAAAVLLVYTAVFLGLAHWRFLTRDVLGSG